MDESMPPVTWADWCRAHDVRDSAEYLVQLNQPPNHKERLAFSSWKLRMDAARNQVNVREAARAGAHPDTSFAAKEAVKTAILGMERIYKEAGPHAKLAIATRVRRRHNNKTTRALQLFRECMELQRSGEECSGASYALFNQGAAGTEAAMTPEWCHNLREEIKVHRAKRKL
jgi:hypothetical protein